MNMYINTMKIKVYIFLSDKIIAKNEIQILRSNYYYFYLENFIYFFFFLKKKSIFRNTISMTIKLNIYVYMYFTCC